MPGSGRATTRHLKVIEVSSCWRDLPRLAGEAVFFGELTFSVACMGRAKLRLSVGARCTDLQS